jgi:hypothetical protein
MKEMKGKAKEKPAELEFDPECWQAVGRGRGESLEPLSQGIGRGKRRRAT